MKSRLEDTLRDAPIGRLRLFEQVAAHLEGVIVSGDLRPGDQLPSERELMRLFSVGRPAVREALFELQRKGIVSARTGERPVVASPTAEVIFNTLSSSVGLYLTSGDGMRDFQHARRVMEAAVARDVARQATPADLERLAEALDKNLHAKNDPTAFVKTDVVFHLEIARVMGSQLMLTLYKAMDTWLSEQRFVSTEQVGSRQAAIDAHQAIFEAIRLKDPDAAETAMNTHLREVEDFYWKARAQVEAEARPAPEKGTPEA